MTWEQWLSRRKPHVRERLRRMNSSRPEPGIRIRGWHPAQTLGRIFDRDIVSRHQFDARWGAGSFDRLPPHLKVNLGGKRRAVTGVLLMDGPPWLSRHTVCVLP